MNNGLGLIKRVVALFLVLLLSIENFAAVVSDNDGSAFITKAEFEALKQTFADQINNYNYSIDNKIDGAIAAYLAGMRVDKTVNLKSLLTNEGKYGGYTEYWCSSPSCAFDNNSTKYSRDTWIVTHNLSYYSMSVELAEPQYKDWAEYERDYYTSKKTKIELNDSSTVIGLERMKVTSKMEVSLWESKMYEVPWGGDGGISDTTFEWTPYSMRSALNNNRSNVHQNTTNVNAFAAGNYHDISDQDFKLGDSGTWANHKIWGWNDYLTWGSISTSTGEITTQYEKENISCPLSNADDYYWNPEDDTSTPVSSLDAICNATNCKNRSSIETLKRGLWKKETTYEGIRWKTISPMIFFLNTTPWVCTSGIKAKDAYLKHWISTSPKNRQVKNGMHIATTDANCKLVMEAEADKKGKLYVYIGDEGTVIDNWTSSSFKGKTFDIEENKNTKCEIEEVQRNKDIWIIYLPSSQNDKALLKINNLYELVNN